MSDTPVIDEPQVDEPQVEPQADDAVSVSLDEEEAAAPVEVDAPQFNVVSGEVPAQVSPAAPEGTPAVSVVHEVHAQVDQVITDPSSPEAVSELVSGSLDLPVHALSGKTPEEQFADAAE